MKEGIVKLKRMGVMLAGGALLLPFSVQAQESLHPKLDARFYLDIGAYLPTIDTAVRVDRAGGTGTVLDLEDDLDFDDSTVLPYGMINFRLGERWHLEAEYFAINRDNTTVIDQELEIGDEVFPVNATVNSFLDTDVYRLGVGYSFLKRPNSELGVSLGVHVTTFDLGVSTAGGAAESADTLAPLPTLGFYGYYAFSPRWLVQGRADVFSLDYDDYSGSLLNLNLGLEFQLAKHVGLGAGYRYVDLELTSEKTLTVGSASDDFRGEFNYQYSGPTLYMSFSY